MDWSPAYMEDGSDSGVGKVIDDEQPFGWGEPVDVNDGRIWRISFCNYCRHHALWIGSRIVYPGGVHSVPPPNPDLPDASKELYEEAAGVLPISRRAAAALCRASLESFVKILTGDLGPNARLDTRLAELSKAVPSHLAKLLQALRHIGNTSLHGPRDDDQSVVMYLDKSDDDLPRLFFEAINSLADELITKPRRADQVMEALPEGVKESIERKNRQATERGGG